MSSYKYWEYVCDNCLSAIDHLPYKVGAARRLRDLGAIVNEAEDRHFCSKECQEQYHKNKKGESDAIQPNP
jgi:hypothetical protein